MAEEAEEEVGSVEAEVEGFKVDEGVEAGEEEEEGVDEGVVGVAGAGRYRS